MNKSIMNKRHVVTLLGAAATLASVSLQASPVVQVEQKEQNGTVTARVTAAPPAGVGWQAYYLYAVPPGQNLIFTYTCPTSAPTPVGNSFNPTPAAKVGLELIASLRPSTKKDSWSWEIHWPSGAPANSKINFNIYCVQ